MTGRPYVLLSACLSLDGYLDNASARRLVLSNPDDLDRVDAVRAGSDAILVGAGTIRADDPRLLVRSEARRAARVARGLPATPLKVTVTRGAALPADSRFFRTGDGEKLVVTGTDVAARATDRFGGVATVVDGGPRVSMEEVTRLLHERGVRRLLVEGGGTVHTQFLRDGLVDELHVAIAPLFVGDCRAPRFVGDGPFPWDEGHRARLADVRPVGDVVLLRYALSDRFGEWDQEECRAG